MKVKPRVKTANQAGLSQKQENFCQAYIETGNASGAYRTAYSVSGMKPATINRKATGLMAKGAIRARISELQQHHDWIGATRPGVLIWAQKRGDICDC